MVFAPIFNILNFFVVYIVLTMASWSLHGYLISLTFWVVCIVLTMASWSLHGYLISLSFWCSVYCFSYGFMVFARGIAIFINC